MVIPPLISPIKADVAQINAIKTEKDKADTKSAFQPAYRQHTATKLPSWTVVALGTVVILGVVYGVYRLGDYCLKRGVVEGQDVGEKLSNDNYIPIINGLNQQIQQKDTQIQQNNQQIQQLQANNRRLQASYDNARRDGIEEGIQGGFKDGQKDILKRMNATGEFNEEETVATFTIPIPHTDEVISFGMPFSDLGSTPIYTSHGYQAPKLYITHRKINYHKAIVDFRSSRGATINEKQMKKLIVILLITATISGCGKTAKLANIVETSVEVIEEVKSEAPSVPSC